MTNIKINSWNETDPLRCIMFGNINNSYNLPVEFPCQIRSYDNCRNNIPMKLDEIEEAEKLRNNLKKILKDDFSVKIIEADEIDHGKMIKTPNWILPNTNEHSCPRDTFSIIGNTIVEAPMSWRCRYFESQIFHEPLLKLYSVFTLIKLFGIFIA